jgi:hypothetical protein
MRSRRPALSILLLAALLVPVLVKSARAQCPPGVTSCIGTNGQIIIVPPPVPSLHVDPQAEARARAEAEARARAEADARARADYEAKLRLDALNAEMSRVLAWQVYLGWQITARGDVEARASVDLQAAARMNAERQPDPYVGRMLPVLGPKADRPIGFPRVDFGPFSLCAAVFTGPGLVSYKGYCPVLRYRLNESWSVLAEPSLFYESHHDSDFLSLGFHPAVAYSFANGHGDHTGSHAFVRAGVDGDVPLAGGSTSPDAFVGGHVGLGGHLSNGLIGGGLETRGLVRGGTSTSDYGNSKVRLGAEIRIYVSFSW